MTAPTTVATASFARLLLLAALAALVATLCDANHVYTGALSYPEPFFAGQAAWVYPGFLGAFLIMGGAYLWLVRRLPASLPVVRSSAPGNFREFTEAVTAFALVYLASGFGNAHPALLAAIFYGTFALRWLATYERGWLLALALAMAVGGMFVEGLLAALGLVAYREPEIFHVPWWLGGLYLHGAFALREGLRFIVYRR